MMEASCENKYRFNMQVSARAMADAIALFRNRTTARHDRLSRYSINDSRLRAPIAG
jgi:hypothetical protein